MAKVSPGSLLLFLFLLPCCPSLRVDIRKAPQTRTDAHTQTRNTAELAPAEEAAEEAKVSESAPQASDGEPTVATMAAVAAAPPAGGAEQTVEREARKMPTARQVQVISWSLDQVQKLKALGNSRNIWHATWAGTFAAIGDLLKKSLQGHFLQIQGHFLDDRNQSWNERWTGILTAIKRFIESLDGRKRWTTSRQRVRQQLRREIAFVSKQLQKELERGISNDVKELQMQLQALGSSTTLESGSWRTLAELSFKLAALQELYKFHKAMQHQWYGEYNKERQELQKLQEVDAAKFEKLKERLSEGMGYTMKGSLQKLLEDFQADK